MSEEEPKLPCSGKMAFNSRKEAKGVAVSAQWHHGGELKVYRCKYCQLWHLAST